MESSREKEEGEEGGGGGGRLLNKATSAKTLASNLWKALGRRGRGRGVGRLLNKALFAEASPRGPVPYP